MRPVKGESGLTASLECFFFSLHSAVLELYHQICLSKHTMKDKMGIQYDQHQSIEVWQQLRVVSRFLSRRFHPKSRRLFPFYFSNITLRTDLLTFGVTGAVFKIAGEMRRLPTYFDNPDNCNVNFSSNGPFKLGQFFFQLQTM